MFLALYKLFIFLVSLKDVDKNSILPLSLSFPSVEPTPRSSLTKKLSVDPPPSNRHLQNRFFIYIIKKDIRIYIYIYVVYSRTNG